MAKIDELLSYRDSRGAKPLILVHGFPLDHTIWLPLADELKGICRVILPDLRGYGASPLGDAKISMESMAGDLVHLLDHLGLEKAVFGGHSMGGYVVQNLARLFPERLAGLALINSLCFADNPERAAERRILADACESAGPQAVIHATLSMYSPSADITAFCEKLMSEAKGRSVAASLRAMAERRDSCETLAGLKVPVMAVYGDQDKFIPAARSEEMGGLVPQMRMIRYRRGGHMTMMESPARMAGDLLDLLNQSYSR